MYVCTYVCNVMYSICTVNHARSTKFFFKKKILNYFLAGSVKFYIIPPQAKKNIHVKYVHIVKNLFKTLKKKYIYIYIYIHNFTNTELIPGEGFFFFFSKITVGRNRAAGIGGWGWGCSLKNIVMYIT